MKGSDDLQQLWRSQQSLREDKVVWNLLIEEKHTSFSEIVRAENRAEYLIALIMGPLLSLTAWKARFPMVCAGFVLLAATLVALAILTWIAQGRREQHHDRNLREHLQALLKRYDDRIRFLVKYTVAAGIPLSLGVGLVVLGMPNSLTNPAAWILTFALIVLFWGAACMWLRRRRSDLLGKRQQVAHILRDLAGEG